MAKAKPEEWLTTAQVAAMMGCGQPNVQRLIREGRLQAQKVVDRWLVSRSSVEAHLANPPKRGRKPKGGESTEG